MLAFPESENTIILVFISTFWLPTILYNFSMEQKEEVYLAVIRGREGNYRKLLSVIQTWASRIVCNSWLSAALARCTQIYQKLFPEWGRWTQSISTRGRIKKNGIWDYCDATHGRAEKWIKFFHFSPKKYFLKGICEIREKIRLCRIGGQDTIWLNSWKI